jgi:NAD(P)-dependent dehydrogenase (short-subunit alcohol dehydrogenase family)
LLFMGRRENQQEGSKALKTGLSGKTAIVTGGSKGYGSGIAEALKRRDANVWITGRDEAALVSTASRLGVNWFQGDVTSPRDWDRLFDVVMGEMGRLDILVNNAGAGIRIAPLAEMSDDEIHQSIAVNLTGAILGCRRAARVMAQQESGIIINVSSACQREAWPGWSVYSAAKAGLYQLSNCLYTELREKGVRVTTLIASWGATEFLQAADLAPFGAELAAKCIQPDDLGDLVVTICELPSHLEMQDVTLWPLVQKVEPL